MITAGFAVLSGFALYLLKSLIDGYWLRYLRKYKELRANTEYILTLYANAYANVVERNDEWHEEASRSIREMGAKMGAFAIERPSKCLGVPKKDILQKVSSDLIGLSNGMVAAGEKAFKKLENNDRCEARIRTLLKLEKHI